MSKESIKLLELTITVEMNEVGFNTSIKGTQLETGQVIADSVTAVISKIVKESLHNATEVISEGMTHMGIDNRMVCIDKSGSKPSVEKEEV